MGGNGIARCRECLSLPLNAHFLPLNPIVLRPSALAGGCTPHYSGRPLSDFTSLYEPLHFQLPPRRPCHPRRC